MINITFPDGKVARYDEPVEGARVTHDISPSLAKKALAMTVDGQPTDLSTVLSHDSSIRIITSSDAEGLDIIRHDAAHLLAQAVKRLYPDTQIVLGPVIKDGFYYDLLPTKPFSEEELTLIEEEMRKISAAAYPISKEIKTRDEAIEFFESMGEAFKAKIIADIPPGEQLTLYTQAEFTDLCRGPHAPSTKFCKYFKLTKVSGSYWRGDSRNTSLQRIYGTAWASQEELDNHLRMLEEAERRDHRKLGKQLDLFHLQDEAPGAVFWHERGYTLYLALQNYIRRKVKQHGYVEVKTPILVDRTLWEKSGHWEKFRENMFVTEESDNKIMALKPMNCPCHIQIFKQGLKSYRDLPLRMAEFGCCHRNEASGALHGLMRVREFVQDDAHIFCTEDQIVDETGRFVQLLLEIYKDLGFDEVTVKLSDRPEKRAGADEVWNKAEAALEEAIKATGLSYTINKGEGAFYGPKLEFVLRDAIGRDWQCGTLQVDFVLPERLDAEYVDNHGKRVRPVMLHRAILGTLERFLGILIENCEGKFPLWLAPVQIAVLPITDDVLEYARELCDNLKAQDVRAILDASNEKLDYKIRKHSLMKVELLAIVGHREKENRTVTIRMLGKQEQLNYTEAQFYDYMIQQTRST